MKLKDIMKALQAIEDDRSLSKEIVVEALQEALAKAYRKHIEIPDALVRVDINGKEDDIRVLHQYTVVEEIEDDELEISLTDARKIKAEYQLGDLVEKEVSIANFGRAAVILAKNVMKQKIREAEKQAVYDEYCDKLEEMVSGVVETVEEKFAIVSLGKTLAMMPKAAQIPGERYVEGQIIKVVITEVTKEGKGAQVLVSRADASLVKRLFEKEVPEIFQGVIEIKAIARDPGERCKMAVYSNNENVDPIGACIGPRGSRVQGIIDELNGEKMDIFEWKDDKSELIKNALAPAEILAVIPNAEKRGLLVVVNDNQLSLAIGKKGKNARLAVKLTGSKIDIKAIRDVEEMGIDWKAISLEQQRVAQEKEAEEKEIAQKAHYDTTTQAQEELPSEDLLVEIEETSPTQTEVEVKEDVVEEKTKPEVVEETEFEKAARIAKEKAKQKVDLSEKQSYVSKFERIAGAPVKKEEKTFRPRYKKQDEKEKEEEVLTKSIDELKKEYDLKPIYSEEELAEIEKQTRMEEESSWVNDEIDFDEYDEFYDEE